MIIGDSSVDYIIARGKDVLCARVPSRKLVGAYVVALALGEAIEKYGASASTVGDQHAKPSRTTLAWPRHALLDQSAPEIGIDQAALGPLDCVKQSAVSDALISREPREPFGDKQPHASQPIEL